MPSYTAITLAAFALLMCYSHESLFMRIAANFYDVQICQDVAREMLNGKTLYSEIYDHKGPWLFLTYLPAMFYDPWGQIGLFLAELVPFTIWAFIIYRFCITRGYKASTSTLATITALFMFTSSYAFYAGQTEFFALPMLEYALVAYINCLEKKRALTTKEALIIGLCPGWCLWAKFTLCACFLLLAVALVLVLHYIKHLNNTKLIAKHLCIVLGGVAIMTAPVALYFAAAGDIALPIREYFIANLFGGYLQSSTIDTQIDQYYAHLLPYLLPMLLLAFGVCIKRKLTKGIGFFTVWLAYIEISFFALGRGGLQYLEPLFVVNILWAIAFCGLIENTEAIRSNAYTAIHPVALNRDRMYGLPLLLCGITFMYHLGRNW